MIEQIAAEVGVSPNTVLRVLRQDNKEIWPSAIRRGEQIRRVAARLGYLPNGSARAIRRGRFNAVGLLLSTDEGRSYLPTDLFNGIHDALLDRGMHLVVAKLPDEQLTKRGIFPRILKEWCCDGLLVNYTDRIPAGMEAVLANDHVPSIWINRKQDRDAVYYDDFGGAATATEQLLALGHRRIAYLDFLAREQWDAVHYSRTDRYEGYAHAMRRAGLMPTPRDQFAGVPVEQRLSATMELLKGEDRPTAIIGYDAGTRMLHAAALAGVHVPQGVSLVTFNPKPMTSKADRGGELYIGRTVGSMRIPVEEAGHKAVDMLLHKLAAPGEAMPTCVLPLAFDGGDTCGQATTAA